MERNFQSLRIEELFQHLFIEPISVMHVAIKIEGLTQHGFISKEAVKFDHLFFRFIDLSESS